MAIINSISNDYQEILWHREKKYWNILIPI